MIMREMFRCVWMDYGDMSVIMTGHIMILQQSVNSWAILVQVSYFDSEVAYRCVIDVLMQL